MRHFNAGRYSLELGKKTYIMGILNVTPDSFSDGGLFFNKEDALRQAEKMIAEGADIIDIGAVSTRPFADDVSAEEEWIRLKNVIPEIIKRFDVPLSVDTFNPSTAKRCLDAGADIINDVSGIFSSDMAEIIKRSGCGWIMMHGGVALRKAEEETEFPDGIINDVNRFFSDCLRKTADFGIAPENICLDPGFGFSKNEKQNTELLKNFSMLSCDGRALVCALSRKRFIGYLTGETDKNKLDSGTLAANIAACLNGADIIRVHNVALHKKSTALIDALRNID